MHVKLLLVGLDDAVLASQAAIFRKEGYIVLSARSETELMQHLESNDFQIAVFNHTLKPRDRWNFAAMVKQHDPLKLVMILHASGGQQSPHADAAVDSRKGPEAMLQAVRHLTLMNAVRDHDHTELKSEYVVVVDQSRHYTFVSDAVCNLLGFERAELIGKQIEEISHGKREEDVEAQFRQFVEEGVMEGEFALRHRSGTSVPIRYSARVQPDGCLMAVWEPLERNVRAG